MKYKKQVVYLGAVLLIMVLTGTFIFYLVNGNDGEPNLTIRQAVKIFKQQDISLLKTSDPDAEMMNVVKPVTYFIDDTRNKLHIYHYDSIGERKTAADMWSEKVGRHYFSTPNNTAKNLLLIIEPMDEKEMTIADFEQIGKVYRAVFEKLNDTREIIYTGTGTNWSSQTTVKYYEYFYKDEKAVVRYESWYKESTSLKYLGDDIESVGVITYEMKSAGGGGSGTGPTLKPDGTVSLGSSGGNGSIPREDETITFIIKWNDQQETFTAKGNGQASD